MNKEIEEISNKLITEINQFSQVVENYKSVEKKVNEGTYLENSTESIEKRLKKQEGYYDRLYELYERNKQIVECENRVKKMLEEYMKMVNVLIDECKNKNETIGNQMNELLEEMKVKEKEIKREKYDDEYEDVQYGKYEIETELVKQKRND